MRNLQAKPIASNMTELTVNGIRILFSYSTPVAYHDGRPVATDKRYSKTTSSHVTKYFNKEWNINKNEINTIPHSEFELKLNQYMGE